MGPPGRGTRLYRAQHRELGAVQLSDDRDGRERSERRLVGRCQMVEVEDIRVGGACVCQRLAPGGDEALVLFVADAREHAIRGTRAVLVRRLKRDRRDTLVPMLRRGRVVDRPHVDTGEERRRIRRLAGCFQRPCYEGRLPADGRQPATERAGDVGRAAAGEEEERGVYAAAVPAIVPRGRRQLGLG